METTYNGWTNYPTWRINLEICSDYLDSLAGDSTRFDSAADLADHLKDYVDEVLTGFGEKEDGLTLDYARAFVDGVNWDEIAHHWTDELIRSDEDGNEDA